jgi:hypothetical protein
MLEEILTRPATNFPVSLITYFIIFFESFALSLIVHAVYRHRKSYLSSTHSFSTVMLMMAPTVATILLFIGSNLALSIGLIGSLSIIRFRTVIKDPLDLMYLFLLIGIGLGCGTQNYLLAAVATVLLSATLFFIHPKNGSSHGALIIARDPESQKLVKLGDELKKISGAFVQERFDLSAHMNETVWSLDKDLPQADKLMSDLKTQLNLGSLTYLKQIRD